MAMTKHWVDCSGFLTSKEEHASSVPLYLAADLHAFLDKVLEELGDTRYTERCRLANVVAMCKEALRTGGG